MWAVAAILFRRVGDHVSAMGINLGKGMVALICLGILLLFAGDFSTIGDESLTALALSGLIGICFGDTLYFLTLVRLGPRRTLLLGAMIPVTTALIAVAFLHERVTGMAWLGVLCTIAGVTYVLWQRAPEGGNQQVRQAGLFYGILFVLANALGIIAAKVGVSDVPAMEATFIRQIFAIAGLTFWGLMVRDLLGWVAPLKDRRVLKVLVMAAVIGAFLGTWLSIVALKYTHAAVAASLNSTSPLFILPLAAFLLKERVSVREVVGAVVAVVGVGLYFSSLGLA